MVFVFWWKFYPQKILIKFYKGILHYNANEMFTISADIVFKPQMLLMTPY